MIKQDTLMTSKAQKRLWMSFLVKEMQGVKKKKKKLIRPNLETMWNNLSSHVFSYIVSRNIK